MPRPYLHATLLWLALLSWSPARPAQQRNKRYEAPKSQVQPLPPELPMALAAATGALDFHISPLLRTGGLAVQIRQSLNDLIHDTRGETIIKLRAFVAGAGDARRVRAEVAAIFTEHRLPLPVVSVVQIGGLGDEAAKVVIEAVVATRRTANPNGLAFLAGQTGATLTGAFEHLRTSATTAGLAPGGIVSCTCFTSRIENYVAIQGAIQATFPHTAVNIVQALRDPASDASSCEAVGQLSQPPQGAVVWLENARATLVNSPQLVFTGLQLTFGSFLDDAHEAFMRLQRVASAVQPVEAPVEVDAFSLDASASSALRRNASVPPSTFTVQSVEGLPAIDASGGIEAIMAPNVSDPVSIAR